MIVFDGVVVDMDGICAVSDVGGDPVVDVPMSSCFPLMMGCLEVIKSFRLR
jgi:hypothetical protein